MNRNDLIAQLTASLLDSATAFKPEDFGRHLTMAVADYSRYRPMDAMDELTLMAGVAVYPCPDDLDAVLGCDWGRAEKATGNPWDTNWPGQLPEIRPIRIAGERRLRLNPAPSAAQISTLGNVCAYRYATAHVADETHCTLRQSDVDVVLLRAQAEAMRELAMKGVTKPVQMRDGMSQGPKNGTPSFLYALLMAEFTEKVMR